MIVGGGRGGGIWPSVLFWWHVQKPLQPLISACLSILLFVHRKCITHVRQHKVSLLAEAQIRSESNAVQWKTLVLTLSSRKTYPQPLYAAYLPQADLKEGWDGSNNLGNKCLKTPVREHQNGVRVSYAGEHVCMSLCVCMHTCKIICTTV